VAMLRLALRRSVLRSSPRQCFNAGHGNAKRCPAPHGKISRGYAWLGDATHGSARRGNSRQFKVSVRRSPVQGVAAPGKCTASKARFLSLAKRGIARRGPAKHSKVSIRAHARPPRARQGAARHCKARFQCGARCCIARRSMAPRGKVFLGVPLCGLATPS
jgi:hypothetical protein